MGLPIPPFVGDIFGPDAVIMKGINGTNWRLKDYEARGGYSALKKIIAENIPPEQVVNEVRQRFGNGHGSLDAGLLMPLGRSGAPERSDLTMVQ